MKKTLLYFLLFVTIFQSGYGQNGFPKDYFDSPLDIPLFLSGTFGELRSNHFHSGIDIKTGGVEGKNVYAPADGYVSRIKVSASGYGNALYINHPNGYTTVYGHLKSFSDAVTKYIKQNQYEKESFEIELFPSAEMFPVKKGEVIALSGNTGGSGGPHLHFEIRRTSDEHPLNVLHFGFNVKDEVQPVIKGVMAYPLDNTGHVNHTGGKVLYACNGRYGKYNLNSTIECSGLIGIGIDTYDVLNGASNHNGVYSVELKANGKRIFFSQIDEFAFDQTRFLNAHIDYEYKLRKKKFIQKSFLTDYNKLPFYSGLMNYGFLTVLPDSVFNMEYIVKDVYGNTSILPFQLQGKKSNNYITPSQSPNVVKQLPHHKSSFYKTDDVEVRFPEYSFYSDLDFEFEKLPAKANTYSSVFGIHSIYTPVHRYYSLSITVDSIPQGLEEKLLIVSYDLNGKPVAEGGTLRGNEITTKTRSFGEYTVMADTTPPVITPINISEGKNMSGSSQIRLSIKDDLAGIESYRGTINDEWVLMEFDSKTKSLTYYFDEHCPKGNNTFKLVVADERGNTTTYTAKFTR